MIFNNHLLRTNDFEHVTMGNAKENEEQFNTLFDFAIDYSGKPVTRILSEVTDSLAGGTKFENIRMYQLDTIKTMNTAFYDELRSVDGWYGFYNTGYINIPNGELSNDTKTETIALNKILNNEVPCGFIDL